MAIKLALENLYEKAVAQFTAEGLDVDQRFGWRESYRRPSGLVLGANPAQRIVWIPGDPSNSVGALGPPRQPGRNPRPLFTLRELFTVEIFSLNITDRTSEIEQYKKCRLLYDDWLRICYHNVHGTFGVDSQTWLAEYNEFRRGAAIQVVAYIEAMVPDLVRTGAPVDTAAEIDVSELDQTDPTETYAPA